VSELRVTRVRAIVGVPWRLRLRYWWLLRRLTPAQREALDAFDRELERRVLYGDERPS
jgi:hypothetical protein